MTFKHVKFGDSVTMRSLEKVAYEKGWIQPDPLLKTAAAPKELDLYPSDNLMENILKLCTGLRQAGFEKHAEQVENLFVAYKQAQKQQHYDVSNEKGEDLIGAAHPEGGHQMEGVEGDAYVEDILEKHLKMLDVADADPKGKMASSRSVLAAVKVALGAPPLGDGRANSSRKIALGQDVTDPTPPDPAPTSSGVGDAVKNIALTGASLVLFNKAKAIISKWRMDGAVKDYDVATVQLAKAQKNFSAAEKSIFDEAIKNNPAAQRILSRPGALNALTKEVVNDVKTEAAQVAETAGKAAVETAGKAVVRNTGQPGVAQDVFNEANKSGLFGKTPAGTVAEKGALETAETVGKDVAIDAGELAVAGKAAGFFARMAPLAWDALTGLVVTTGGVVAAGVGAAIIGGVIGYEHFDAVFNTEDLKEAATNLIEDGESKKDDLGIKYAYVTRFKALWEQIEATSEERDALMKSKEKADMAKLFGMDDLFAQSAHTAQSLQMVASSLVEKEFFGEWNKAKSIVLEANNYIRVVGKKRDEINALMQKINQALEAKQQQESSQNIAAQGGPDVANLKNLYTSVQQDIVNYSAAINAKSPKPANSTQLLQWLARASKILVSMKAGFAAAQKTGSASTVVKIYTDRLNKLKDKLNTFKTNWIDE